METKKQLFDICLKQEIELISNRGIPFVAGWNVSETLNTAEFNRLINRLISTPHIKAMYVNEENIKSSVLRAFDRYLINISFTDSIKYDRKLANRVFKCWEEELADPKIKTVILASMLNFEVNRPVKFGDVELLPITKNGKVIELENNLYKLLGFKGIRDIKRNNEFASYRITYFLGGNAIRVKGKFPKREEFYRSIMLPEIGYQELLQKITNFVTLLRLFKSGDFKVGSYHYAISSPFTPGEVHFGETKYSNGYQYPLVDKKEIVKLRYFVKKFLPVIEKLESLPPGLQIGIEYLRSSYEKIQNHEKFIDLMIALDALLGTNGETSYRVSLRAAWLLGKDKVERQEIYKNVRLALKLRGKLVHGDIHPNQEDKNKVEENKLFIENMVRRVIIQLISLHIEGKLDNKYKEYFEEVFVL